MIIRAYLAKAIHLIPISFRIWATPFKMGSWFPRVEVSPVKSSRETAPRSPWRHPKTSTLEVKISCPNWPATQNRATAPRHRKASLTRTIRPRSHYWHNKAVPHAVNPTKQTPLAPIRCITTQLYTTTPALSLRSCSESDLTKEELRFQAWLARVTSLITRSRCRRLTREIPACRLIMRALKANLLMPQINAWWVDLQRMFRACMLRAPSTTWDSFTIKEREDGIQKISLIQIEKAARQMSQDQTLIIWIWATFL